MHKAVAVVAAALPWLAATGPAQADASPPARPVQLAAELGLARVDEVQARLRQPFETPLPARLAAAAGGQRVELRDCADWLARRSQVVGSDNDASWRVLRHQVVVCDALALLASAPGASGSALPAPGAPLLDTRAWPGSLWVAPSPEGAARLARPGLSLRSASGVARWERGEGGSLVVADGRWRVVVTELARADVDGDGWEDLLLRWEGQAVQGSYADARLVVLTRRASTQPLQRVEARR